MARSRYRAVRYDLAASIEVARIVEEAGGVLAADLLAPALGYSGTNNGAYLARVASARLFGLVGGRGTRIELTPRGREVLAGTPGASRQAFLAVPLFRAVAEWLGEPAMTVTDDLARLLVSRFGEAPDRAAGSADRFWASAGQAGLLAPHRGAKAKLTALPTNFTTVENLPNSGARWGRIPLKATTRGPWGGSNGRLGSLAG